MNVLECVGAHGLFEIPESLQPFLGTAEEAEVESVGVEAEEEANVEVSPASLRAWRDFLESRYGQIGPYAEYVADVGAFSTHQGVKGLEFDRVLVVMDDSEARGFLFSYEKFFGATPLSDGDKIEIAQDEETGIDRTRRLLYVTCTRTKQSLALMAYTSAPDQLESAVVRNGWFEPSEILRL
ncbi:MAG: hypothetical protein IID55_02285 [Proteobacteria bacterium]|nr:hypothetical protein [Pseudomonadota bacterium]